MKTVKKMLLQDLIEGDFQLKVLNKKEIDLNIQIYGCYTCDLLSQVLAKARGKSIWITIQNHLNIIGVATMLELKGIIICEDREVPDEVVTKADEENILILSYQSSAYEIGGRLFEKGIR
jgi:hypothetical protein